MQGHRILNLYVVALTPYILSLAAINFFQCAFCTHFNIWANSLGILPNNATCLSVSWISSELHGSKIEFSLRQENILGKRTAHYDKLTKILLLRLTRKYGLRTYSCSYLGKMIMHGAQTSWLDQMLLQSTLNPFCAMFAYFKLPDLSPWPIIMLCSLHFQYSTFSTLSIFSNYNYITTKYSMIQ